MDSELFDNIMFELKLVSKIKKDDKLTTSGEKLGIDSGGALQPLWRSYYGESRTATLTKLEKLCDDIYEYLNEAISKVKNSPTLAQTTHQKNNVNQQLKSMWLQLSGTIKGMENLKVTYNNDASVESGLDICIDKIKGYIQDIDNNLFTGSTKKSDSSNPLVTRIERRNFLPPISGLPKQDEMV